MSLNPSLPQIIEAAIETGKQEHWSSLSGTVHAVLGQGCVDVEPNSDNPIPDETGATIYEALPIVPNVRVLWPRSSKAAFTFPIAVGDSGLLVMLTLSDDEWRNGQPGQPGDIRRNHLAFAIFIPGLFPDSKPATYADDPDVVIDVAGGVNIRLGGTATDLVALKSLVESRFQELVSPLINAPPVPNDGGANIQAAVKIALGLAGWNTSTGAPPNCGAQKVKAL